MTGGVKPKPKPKKPSNTACKQTAKLQTGQTVTKGAMGGTAASRDIGLKKAPVNIPMRDMSPEFKNWLLKSLVEQGGLGW